jgi:hypothetical protein
MPWSPVPKFPGIIQDLKRRGYRKEVTFEILRVAVMRATGSIKEKTIGQTIKAMEDLGFLKRTGSLWLVCQGQEYRFLEDTGGEANQLDKMIE